MTQFALTMIFSIRYRLLRYAPTNILVVRTLGRRGLGWVLLAGGLAVLYFYAASICTTILSHDGPRWLNALVILFVWNGFKMLRIDPATLVLRGHVHITGPDRTASPNKHGDMVPAQHGAQTSGATR